MKKLALGVFFIGIAFSGFSQNKTFWIDMGVGWDNKFESSGSQQQVKTSMSSFALDLGRYEFKENRNIGYFTHSSFIFPRRSTIEANGIKVKVDLASGYDFIMGLEGTTGIGFRLNVNDKIVIGSGIGPNLGVFFATNEYARQLSWMFGIGGAVELKFKITDLIGISIGDTLSYSFACYTIGSNTLVGDISGWAKGYSLIGVKPYICLSLNGFIDSGNRQHFNQ
jgi:hypothetical protein